MANTNRGIVGAFSDHLRHRWSNDGNFDTSPGAQFGATVGAATVPAEGARVAARGEAMTAGVGQRLGLLWQT